MIYFLLAGGDLTYNHVNFTVFLKHIEKIICAYL